MLAPIVATVLAAAVFTGVAWPPKVPYVTRKGSDVHETIWFWRVPAYVDHPAWQLRWTWRDGPMVRAYCYNPEQSAKYRDEMPIISR